MRTFIIIIVLFAGAAMAGTNDVHAARSARPADGNAFHHTVYVNRGVDWMLSAEHTPAWANWIVDANLPLVPSNGVDSITAQVGAVTNLQSWQAYEIKRRIIEQSNLGLEQSILRRILETTTHRDMAGKPVNP